MDDRRGFPITIPNWIHYVITRVVNVTRVVGYEGRAGIESIVEPIISSPETRLDWLELLISTSSFYFSRRKKEFDFEGKKIGDNRWMRIFKIKEDCYLVNKRTDLRKVCTISRERAFIPNVLSLNNRLHLSIYMEHCWTSFTYFITRDETLTLQLPNKRKGKKGWSRKKRSWSNQITNQKSDTDFHVLLNLIQSSRPLLDSSQKSPSAHLPLIDNPLKQFLLPSIPSLSLFLYILYMYISLSLSF